MRKSFALQPDLASSADSSDPQKSSRRLPTTLRLAYSLGHVFNDLCASLWFSYLLLFLNSVLHFPSTTAGLLLLLGQVVDALATPLVGLESDRKRSFLLLCCPVYGKRKAWHLLGTVLVLASFPFLFQEFLLGVGPQGHEPNVGWAGFLYFGALIAIFQVGWAAVQVSHVALITDLTPYPKERVALNVYRHMATVTSNICVYGVTWLVLNSGDDERQVGPHSANSFRTITLTVVGIGVSCSLIFHLLVKEKSPPPPKPSEGLEGGTMVFGRYSSNSGLQEEAVGTMGLVAAGGQALLIRARLDQDLQDEEATGPSRPEALSSSRAEDGTESMVNASSETLWRPQEADDRSGQLSWKQWFFRASFYQVAVLYVSSRLYVNISQVYMALYLQHTLALPKETLAVVPLVVNVSGLLFALLLKPISVRLGNKSSLFLGCCVGASACAWAHLFVPEHATEDHTGTLAVGGWQVYAVGGLFGVGGTSLIVASLAITADLIGTNTRSSAFVFGVMSLFDKLASGAAVMGVQYLNPGRDSEGLSDTPGLSEDNPYYRGVLVYGCGSAVLVTCLGLLTTVSSRSALCVRRSLFSSLNDRKGSAPPALGAGDPQKCPAKEPT